MTNDKTVEDILVEVFRKCLTYDDEQELFRLNETEPVHEKEYIVKKFDLDTMKHQLDTYYRKKYRTCEFCGGTDLVCAKGWQEEREKLLNELKNSRKKLAEELFKKLENSSKYLEYGNTSLGEMYIRVDDIKKVLCE